MFLLMKSSVAKSRSMKASSGSTAPFLALSSLSYFSSVTVTFSIAWNTLTMSSGIFWRTGSSVKAPNLEWTLLAHPEIWSLTILIFLYFSASSWYSFFWEEILAYASKMSSSWNLLSPSSPLWAWVSILSSWSLVKRPSFSFFSLSDFLSLSDTLTSSIE